MGRKRAAFAEGIAKEEQRYAQVLRDIRDLRGETQQVLGRLLGWSMSMVSRFEAAAERPDEATHQRYCALAPTEELRERAMAAYEVLPAHQNDTPRQSGCRSRSGTAAPWTVLGSTSSSRLHIPSTRYCGCSATRPSPCQCGRKRHRASSGRTVEARSGRSTSPSRRPTCAAGTPGSAATPEENGTSSGAWRTGTASSARSTPASERAPAQAADHPDRPGRVGGGRAAGWERGGQRAGPQLVTRHPRGRRRWGSGYAPDLTRQRLNRSARNHAWSGGPLSRLGLVGGAGGAPAKDQHRPVHLPG
jgi:hypothetical protein